MMIKLKFITSSDDRAVYSVHIDEECVSMMMLVGSAGQVVLYGFHPEHADDGRRYTDFEAKYVLNMLSIGAFRIINAQNESVRGMPMLVKSEMKDDCGRQITK